MGSRAARSMLCRPACATPSNAEGRPSFRRPAPRSPTRPGEAPRRRARASRPRPSCARRPGLRRSAIALLREAAPALPAEPAALARLIKAVPLVHGRTPSSGRSPRRRRALRGAGRAPDAAPAAGGLRRRRDARLGSADRRLPPQATFATGAPPPRGVAWLAEDLPMPH